MAQYFLKSNIFINSKSTTRLGFYDHNLRPLGSLPWESKNVSGFDDGYLWAVSPNQAYFAVAENCGLILFSSPLSDSAEYETLDTFEYIESEEELLSKVTGLQFSQSSKRVAVQFHVLENDQSFIQVYNISDEQQLQLFYSVKTQYSISYLFVEKSLCFAKDNYLIFMEKRNYDTTGIQFYSIKDQSTVFQHDLKEVMNMVAKNDQIAIQTGKVGLDNEPSFIHVFRMDFAENRLVQLSSFVGSENNRRQRITDFCFSECTKYLIVVTFSDEENVSHIWKWRDNTCSLSYRIPSMYATTCSISPDGTEIILNQSKSNTNFHFSPKVMPFQEGVEEWEKNIDFLLKVMAPFPSEVTRHVAEFLVIDTYGHVAKLC